MALLRSAVIAAMVAVAAPAFAAPAPSLDQAAALQREVQT